MKIGNVNLQYVFLDVPGMETLNWNAEGLKYATITQMATQLGINQVTCFLTSEI